jgi:hypothetical protein
MGENVPYTSYLSQKEHNFIEKCNFLQGFKNAPFEQNYG